MMMTE